MMIAPEERIKRIKAVARLIAETAEAVELQEVQLPDVLRFIEMQARKLVQLTQ